VPGGEWSVVGWWVDRPDTAPAPLPTTHLIKASPQKELPARSLALGGAEQRANLVRTRVEITPSPWRSHIRSGRRCLGHNTAFEGTANRVNRHQGSKT